MSVVEQVADVLAQGEVVTATTLAAHVQRSERTIYRCVRRLRANGMDVRGEAGVGYLARPPRRLEAAE